MPSTPGQPFSNLKPSLAITEVTTPSGVFPSGGGGGSATGDVIGFVYDFAGNFAPGSSFMLDGQTESITSYSTLFQVIGTTYGGNGSSTFGLPDLQGTAIVGTGTTSTLGATAGAAEVALTLSQIPPNSTPAGGGGQAFDNTQPTLALQRLICVSGVFPSQGGNNGSSTFIGQIATFEGNVTPGGWLPAQGQLLSIQQNQALFAIIGTTYGGNGTTNFALPDLSGRVSVGADTTNPLGTQFGQQSITLTAANLPSGADQAFNHDQPSLALNYLVCVSGVFPNNGGGASFDTATPSIGQIAEFAGNFAPSGWMLAQGQLLSIQQNQALFSVLGTTYGGNGVSNFALPDFRGRTAIGAGTNANVTYSLGTTPGSDTVTLTSANVPTAACFASGTAIATQAGSAKVEDLHVGDLVRTAAGTLRPIIWIGRREIDVARHPVPASISPIRIAPHAFGPDQPVRALLLSPEHAVFVQGVLVPIRELVNHTSITTVAVDRVTYWHVELESHDVILAEQLPVESYLENGNRDDFEGGIVQTLYPRFAASPCAGLVRQGPVLEHIRAQLARRSAQALTAA